MNITNIKIIWFTELKNHFRDRRALLALLGFSLMGPIGILGMFFVISNVASEEKKLQLHVIGADNAPGLIAMFEQADDVVLTRRDGTLGQALPDMGEAEAILVIPADYAQRYNLNIPARVDLYRDDRSQRSSLVAQKVTGMIRDYARGVAISRLVARGVPSQTVTPIHVNAANVAPKDSQSLQIANMVLYFLMFVPFFAGMSIAIDTTAGERERGSLLPLMAQPVSAAGLSTGKVFCVASFGLLAQAIATIMTFNVLHFLPTDVIVLNIPLDLATQGRIMMVLAPVVIIAAPLQVFFALSSKSYKEAQSYLSILAILPVGLVIYGTLISTQASGIEKYIPIIAQSDMMKQVIANGAMPWEQWLVGLVFALFICIAAIFGATRKLGNESLLRVA